MPRGYRSIILAAFGFLSLANAAEHENAKRQQGDYGAKHHQDHTSPSIVPPAVCTENADKSEQGCKGAAQPSLNCDTIAAQAALDQARYARWQAIAAIIATVVGALTVIAAFLAARWAKEAAKHTETGAIETSKSALAAIDAANSAREALKTDRAWICSAAVLHAHAVDGGIAGIPMKDFIVFVPKWKNYGNTPALNVRVYSELRVIGFDEIAPEFFRMPDAQEGAVIGPLQELQGLSLAINDDDTARFRERKAAVAIYSAVTYNTLFDSEVRVSQYCYIARHYGGNISQNGITAEHISFQPEGFENRST